MTPKEMIEVISAFERGEQIEYQPNINSNGDWMPNPNPKWSFAHYNYRTAPKKIKLYAYLDSDKYVRMAKAGGAIPVNNPFNKSLIPLPHLDCEVDES
jgi:hypothetical protein